jgi:lipoate-protein ligase A
LKYLLSPHFDPYLNLALEEQLFKQIHEDFLFIYRNKACVVVGKHQNANAEANQVWLIENDVPLIRRFSGGGTVYHDPENLNFSFITTGEDSKVIDFKKYALPVVGVLNEIGIPASLSKRHDIMVDGFKVSGHAAHAKGKRSLHHGTLLFNADLKALSASLKSDRDRYESKAVQSVRSKVANLNSYQDQFDSTDDFLNYFGNRLKEVFKIESDFNLSSELVNDAKELALEKYHSTEWNYGYSPKYIFEFDEELLSGHFSVEKGIIEDVDVNDSKFSDVLRSMKGQFHYLPHFEKTLIDHFPAEETSALLKFLF